MTIRVARKRADSYQHGDLRRALIQAGLKLLAEGGVRDLSLRAAAQLAGVSHAAPYRHFADKDALVAAIAEEGFRLLTQHMRAEIAARGAGAAFVVRLRASAAGYVGFAVEHPGYFRTIFGGALHDKALPPSLKAAGDEAYHVLRDLIVEGIDAGILASADPDQLSLAAWSLVHGLGMLIIDKHLDAKLAADPAAVRQLAETMTGLLETGIAVRPTRRR
jgi:AcrR family transcriptional regulator